MPGDYNYHELKPTKDLVALADRLIAEMDAGKRIQSGSGGGKSATYEHDSADDRAARLDDVIFELNRRGNAGDEEVPARFTNITPEPTEEVADFSGH